MSGAGREPPRATRRPSISWAVQVPRSSFTPLAALLRSRLKKERVSAGLTQVALAVRLNRPQSFVTKYESGERRIDVIEFLQIAEAVGLDPCRFIGDLLSTKHY